MVLAMNIYQRKFYWKVVILVIAILAVVFSLFYNNRLARELANEEKKSVTMIAKALTDIPTAEGDYQKFLVNVLSENVNIPVILVDAKGGVTGSKNCGLENDMITSPQDSLYIAEELRKMKKGYDPITFDISESQNFVYYKDSKVLAQLKMYPFIQMGIIGSFLLISYLAFSWARRAEQDQVWVGMARETAHQIGTPLSSLMAWAEYLEARDEESIQKVGREMSKDVNRLNLIADRFSKIGSAPKLAEEDIVACLTKTLNYVKRRAASKIRFASNLEESETISILFSPPLIDWVVENLLKNALDSMEGEGLIGVHISEENRNLIIDISDTGNGIPKSNFNDVFKPGYSTKRRGWGLGLSLSKRIVEEYHNGRISVLKSAVGEGTTFRIVLPRTNA